MLIENSKDTVEKEHNKTVKKKLIKFLANSTPHPSFDIRFSASDLSIAINDIKTGKVPGRDEVHPEYLHKLAGNCLL